MAKVWGIIFIIVGVLGFVPAATPNGMLLGIFHVDALHNMVHLLTGVVALWAGFASQHASKMYFLVFGIIYALVSLFGFFAGDRPVLGFLANNIPDAWLHLAIAVVSIGLGLTPERDIIPTKPTATA